MRALTTVLSIPQMLRPALLSRTMLSRISCWASLALSSSRRDPLPQVPSDVEFRQMAPLSLPRSSRRLESLCGARCPRRQTQGHNSFWGKHRSPTRLMRTPSRRTRSAILWGWLQLERSWLFPMPSSTAHWSGTRRPPRATKLRRSYSGRRPRLTTSMEIRHQQLECDLRGGLGPTDRSSSSSTP